MIRLLLHWMIIVSVVVVAAGCASRQPAQVNNVCAIFDEKGGLWDNWHKAAKKASEKYDVPISVIMATMWQESRFKAKAKPPRKKLLGFIPWRRLSSAYGFAQVKKETWRYYMEKSGNRGRDRDKFKDAAEFVAWYHHNTHKVNGVARDDAYHLYLAYHEGNGGFSRKTWAGKPWLQAVARKVAERAKLYETQYRGCEKKLNRGWFF